MFPERLSVDDVASDNLFRAEEIDNLSVEEKEEYIAALKVAMKKIQDEIDYVEIEIDYVTRIRDNKEQDEYDEKELIWLNSERN